MQIFISLFAKYFIVNLVHVIMTLALQFLPPATKLGQGYVFTRVCDSVHKGGVCLSACWDTPCTRHPRPGTPPDQAPPRPGTPPPIQAPKSRACWEILSTSGRYASYWNAILLQVCNASNDPTLDSFGFSVERNMFSHSGLLFHKNRNRESHNLK